MSRMTDKVVLITGAGAGMGRSHAVRLAEEGADIIAVDLPGEVGERGLAETSRLVQALGRRIVTATADVRDHGALDDAVATGVALLGSVDVIVANAGICETPGPSWTIDEEVWNRAIDINLTGAWNTVKAGVSALSPAGGSVIIISSTAGISGAAGRSQYAASKHAVVGLARTLANELGRQSIRVNTVHPGAVGTDMVLNPETFARLRPDLVAPTAADAAEVLRANTLLPVPWVESVDVSNAVLFLASDESRYVTGLQMVVDAGQTQKVA
ncbi:oxidoreductase [Rhodococcus sp. SRB_17]|nr:oxidoreductase [Rhodococcus sp. SRB_17]